MKRRRTTEEVKQEYLRLKELMADAAKEGKSKHKVLDETGFNKSTFYYYEKKFGKIKDRPKRAYKRRKLEIVDLPVQQARPSVMLFVGSPAELLEISRSLS